MTTTIDYATIAREADAFIAILDWIDQDEATRLGVLVSPGMEPARLTEAPRLAIGADGVMRVSVGYGSPTDPPQVVREVARLHKRGLVIIDTTSEVFIMSEEEWAAQV